jgi:hypothetical protein
MQDRRDVSTRWKRLGLAAVLAAAGAVGASAQQPFVTDDAEVTERGHLHFEYANEFYVLQNSSYPNLRQDTNNFVIQYGLFDGVEVNMDFPLIAIGNAHGSGTPSVFGLGDLDFAVKWNLVKENPDGARPAFTVTAATEFPTGNEKKQLGSGLADYVLNTIFQKTFSGTALHANLGLQFAGNTQTGVVGIHTSGRILIGGLSAARDLSERLRLGLDLNGAEIHDGGKVERELQLIAGGNYILNHNETLDFAVTAGWFEAPRFGLILGVSITSLKSLISGIVIPAERRNE